MASYDTAQVCLNGHLVNGRAGSAPELNKEFCGKCGAKTVSECVSCKSSIHGDLLPDGTVAGMSATEAPEFCHKCGKAHSWKGKIVRSEPTKTLYEVWKEKVLNNKIGAGAVLLVMMAAGAFAIWKELPDDVKKQFQPNAQSSNQSTTGQSSSAQTAPSPGTNQPGVKIEVNVPMPDLKDKLPLDAPQIPLNKLPDPPPQVDPQKLTELKDNLRSKLKSKIALPREASPELSQDGPPMPLLPPPGLRERRLPFRRLAGPDSSN